MVRRWFVAQKGMSGLEIRVGRRPVDMGREQDIGEVRPHVWMQSVLPIKSGP